VRGSISKPISSGCSRGRAQTLGEVTVLKRPTEIVRSRTILLIDGVLDRG
jgi:hypothetical protein